MYEFLEREIDSSRFDKLIEIVRNGECALFTGAGLSKPLGYRIWDEGIKVFNEQNPCLSQIAGFSEMDISNLSSQNIIDKCKDKLGSAYYDFLKKEFGRDGKQRHHTNLYTLWKTNFREYITTNFDATLYDHREDCNKLVSYPSDALEYYNERTLYYLHGRAFIVDGETEEVLKYYLNNLVYGEQSYEEAYKEEKAFEPFIYKLLGKCSILFVGFSMKDVDFKNLFENIRYRLLKSHDKISNHPGKEIAALKEHFIFLPYPVDNKLGDEKKYKTAIKQFTDFEEELYKVKISVISYKISAHDITEHSNLNLALSYLKDQTPNITMPKLTELGSKPFDLNQGH
jgi:hypothetical protein